MHVKPFTSKLNPDIVPVFATFGRAVMPRSAIAAMNAGAVMGVCVTSFIAWLISYFQFGSPVLIAASVSFFGGV